MISDRRPDEVLIATDAGAGAVPIWLAPQDNWKTALAHLSPEHIAWLEANGFDGAARKHVLLPGAGGTIEGVVLGIGRRQSRCCRRNEPRRSAARAGIRHLPPR